MELNEMEKKMLFQAEGDCQAKVLNELYMTVRYSNNSELREAAESLMAKVRVLSDRECMDLVRDIQKNYRLPHPPRTIGERIAEARQQSGAEKLKGHDIMGLERFDPEGTKASTRPFTIGAATLYNLPLKRSGRPTTITAFSSAVSRRTVSSAFSAPSSSVSCKNRSPQV